MNNNILIATICVALFTSCKNNNEQKQTEVKNTATHKTITEIFPKLKVDVKTIGILLYDGYTTLDAMGPYQVLSEIMGVDIFFVGRHRGIITNTDGMKVQCDTSIAEVKQLDILVIPGGLIQTYLATKDSTLISWIKAIDVHSKYTASVCTGAWILGATGVLKDKEATTHWYAKKILAKEFGAKVQDKRFVKSGKYWTSAGVSAGMDMSLALINEIAGENYTKAVMLNLEYDPAPPFAGGSEQKANKEIIEGLRTMYDAGMETAMHPEKIFKNMKFDNKKDFVCGMPTTAGVADTAHYKGKLYGFCAAGCKDEFKKNAESYLATK